MSVRFDALDIRLGARAAAHVARDGLSPGDIACVPAAAGGPKGLALIPLDRWLFGRWFARRDPAGAPLELVGASIGAWRMAAAALPDPVAALDRLADAYVAQHYPPKPSPTRVSQGVRALARAVLAAGDPTRPAPGRALTVITARARGGLHAKASRRAFAQAALANAVSRRALATHLHRVVFHAGPTRFPARPFDAFGLERVALDAANAEPALTASGSIPLLCDAVVDPPGAPAGGYWDGGLIDYHLLLPYATLDGLVLYPHFVPFVTPGWLDKFLPWRRQPRAHAWLDNVVLVAPSAAFLAKLPDRKLPDRDDFYRYGLDHDARARSWRGAMQACEGFAEQVARWLEAPDPTVARPLG